MRWGRRGILRPTQNANELCSQPKRLCVWAATRYRLNQFSRLPRSRGKLPAAVRSLPHLLVKTVEIYLPIADLPVNIFLLLGMGLAVGFVSGMFGIGGGFLMTPLLIFVGISPAVSVASVASHIAASSFSGAISYWRRRAIDPALAAVLLVGGTLGTALGVLTFTYLRSLGQLDLMIALSYVVLLSTVGAAMMYEGFRAILRTRRGVAAPRR